MSGGHAQSVSILRVAAMVVFLLAFARSSFSQTTLPVQTAPPPPAVSSAFENDVIERTATAPASAQGKTAVIPANSVSPFDVRRVVLALAIVLGLIFAFRFIARWMFPAAGVGRSSQVIKVLSRSVVAPKQQFLLIQVGRRLVLVGDCGTQMSSLAEITDPDEVAALMGQLHSDRIPADPNARFGPLLGRATRGFERSASLDEMAEALSDREPARELGGDLTAAPDVGVRRGLDRELATASAALSDANEEGDAAATEVDATRGELNGLTEKIRMLSQQLGRL